MPTKRLHPLFHGLLTTTTLVSGLYAGAARAQPTHGTVEGGQAGIATLPSHTTVTQTSQRAVIDWSSFDLSQGQTVQFRQPNASSITLNRVTDVNPSTIDGTITANGQVWLVNANGIAFGKDAHVNVAGLIATSSDIDNRSFMAGSNSFTHPGNASATISNAGTITAGLAALAGPNVSNSGVITARLGTAQLASGDTFTVDLYGDGLINLQASPAMNQQLIQNTGTLKADGGKVLMTAAAAETVMNSLVNLNGLVEADGGSVTISTAGSVDSTATVSAQSGNIRVTAKNVSQQGSFHADGGSIAVNYTGAYADNAEAVTSAKGGSISITGGSGSSFFASGSYDVSSNSGVGGTIQLTAGQMALYAASLNASGPHGGGSIDVGGELHGGGSLVHAQTVTLNPYTTLNADATGSGNGGVIAVWSDAQTTYGASASAKGGPNGGNGGAIEVSSAGQDYVGGTTDASAPHGASGSVLIDPHNITISNTSGSGGGLEFFQLVNPDASGSANGFGTQIVVLSNGNVLVTNPSDNLNASNAGAVFLYNGSTGALISALRGSNAGDQVGYGTYYGITTLTGNSNFVISSYYWNGNIGAATWGSGASGVSGVVSSANSLVGSTAGDYVGGYIYFLRWHHALLHLQRHGALQRQLHRDKPLLERWLRRGHLGQRNQRHIRRDFLQQLAGRLPCRRRCRAVHDPERRRHVCEQPGHHGAFQRQLRHQQLRVERQ